MSLLCSFRVSLSLSFARATVLLVVRDDRLSRISCTFFACPIVTFSFARDKLLANRPWPNHLGSMCAELGTRWNMFGDQERLGTRSNSPERHTNNETAVSFARTVSDDNLQIRVFTIFSPV